MQQLQSGALRPSTSSSSLPDDVSSKVTSTSRAGFDEVIFSFQIPSTAKPETPADSKSKMKQNLMAKKEEDKPVQGAAQGQSISMI
jgi:hypothetical protein